MVQSFRPFQVGDVVFFLSEESCSYTLKDAKAVYDRVRKHFEAFSAQNWEEISAIDAQMESGNLSNWPSGEEISQTPYFQKHDLSESLRKRVQDSKEKINQFHTTTLSKLNESIQLVEGDRIEQGSLPSLPSYIQDMNQRLEKIASDLQSIKAVFLAAEYFSYQRLFFEEKVSAYVLAFFQFQKGQLSSAQFCDTSLGKNMIEALQSVGASPHIVDGDRIYFEKIESLVQQKKLSQAFQVAEALSIEIKKYDPKFALGTCKHLPTSS